MRMDWLRLLTLGVLLSSATCCEIYEEDEENVAHSNLTITSPGHKFPAGEAVSIACQSSNEGATLLWQDAYGAVITNSSHDHMTAVDGQLTISNAQVNDTGDYQCTDGNEARVYTICVYVMPSYLREGMIMLGIIAVLVVIFIGCMILSTIEHRKQAKAMGYKDMPPTPAKDCDIQT